MSIRSVNPKTGKVMKEYERISDEELQHQLDKAYDCYKRWRNSGEEGLKERLEKFGKLKQLLNERREQLCLTITEEMGKPIKQTYNEVDKSIALIDYYVENVKDFLADEEVKTKFPSCWVQHQALGICVNITPWNFPLWTPFKIGIPTLLTGNPIILKHASNVPQVAEMLDDLFRDAGFGDGGYKNVFVSYKQVETIIQDPRVLSLKLVGSTETGKKIGEICGRNLVKSTFELGGSDAFIVFDDAEVDFAVEKALQGRMHTVGQACNNSKRFFIQDSLYDEFLAKLKVKLQEYIVVGDPLHKETTVGPLSSQKSKDDLVKQVKESIEKGATVAFGSLEYSPEDENLKNGAYFYPMILENPQPGSPAHDEELFGPVFTLHRFSSVEEAIDKANAIRYGLSASVFTKNLALAKKMANQLEVGNVFINEIPGSSPQCPSGGVKDSGYGRECYKDGILETVNRKTIAVGKLY